MNVFEIASPRKFLNRNYSMLFALPKIFLCGFLWEGFGLACNCSDRSNEFYFMTGLGGGIGTCTGHLLAYAVPGIFTGTWQEEMWQGLLYGLAVFLGPGTTWQKIVNDCTDWNIDFNLGLLYMWGVSAILFSCSLMGLRFVNEQLLTKRIGLKTGIATAKESWYGDMLLSISVGLADAVFVGTITGWETGRNWMGPAFGVHSDTPAFIGMLKSGASTVVGFVVAQTIQNMIIKQCWLDPAAAEDENGNSAADMNKGTKSSVTGDRLDNVVSDIHAPY